eukprot:g29938.t1
MVSPHGRMASLRLSPTNDQSAGIEEFEKLEQALSANFDSLQELRGRLAPMANSAGTLRCPRRSDLVRAASELQQLLQGLAARRKGKADKKLAESLDDSLAGIPYAILQSAWLWAAIAFGFALANSVLLLNYQRLSLPHVHRRFERQLSHLSSRRERKGLGIGQQAAPWHRRQSHAVFCIREEEILVEIRDLQRSSQKAGAAHARACIFLQSVNVLRNINYVLLCIKTETQRATAAARGFGASQEGVILGGLRLLLALLPRCEKRWEAEILADEDCGHALAALANGHAPEGPLQRLVAESQKRLWILLRMVHLSSVLPIEAQGQLGSLVQRYARPILIEGRGRQVLSTHLHEDTILSVRKTRALPPSVLTLESFTSTGTGMRETLKQLRATRKDLTRILQRLSPEALWLFILHLRSTESVSLQALLARSSEEELAMLHDIFSSAILLLASSNAPRTDPKGARVPGLGQFVAEPHLQVPHHEPPSVWAIAMGRGSTVSKTFAPISCCDWEPQKAPNLGVLGPSLTSGTLGALISAALFANRQLLR